MEHLARVAGGTAFSLLLLAASQGESLLLLAASMELLMQLAASNEKQTPLQFFSKGILMRKLFINVSLYNKFATLFNSFLVTSTL